MSRDTQHAVLLLLGGALLRIALDDTYLRYVRPAQHWPLIAAGAVMVVLAMTAAIRDRVAAAHRPGGHDHGRTVAHVPWLLVLPVLVISLVPPPALGADAVARAQPVQAASAPLEADPLPPGPAPEIGIGDFVKRVVWDGSAALDGREVTLTGFVVHRASGTAVARLTIYCCAADARVSAVRVVGDAGPVDDLPADTWVRVRGTLQSAAVNAETGYSPSVAVSQVSLVPAPADPYEY